MKSFLLVFGGLCAGLVLAGGLYYFTVSDSADINDSYALNKNQIAKQDNTNNNITTQTNVIEYKDNNKGIYFKYPGDFTKNDKEDSPSIRVLQNRVVAGSLGSKVKKETMIIDGTPVDIEYEYAVGKDPKDAHTVVISWGPVNLSEQTNNNSGSIILAKGYHSSSEFFNAVNSIISSLSL